MSLTYKEQLQQNEWKELRELIFLRDHSRCTVCNRTRDKYVSFLKRFGTKKFAEIRAEGYSIMTRFIDKYSVNFNGMIFMGYFLTHSDELMPLESLCFARGRQACSRNYELVAFLGDNMNVLKRTDLNVHHKRYIQNHMAWEYAPIQLTTLCSVYHQREHQENEILIYTEEGNSLGPVAVCETCEVQDIALHIIIFMTAFVSPAMAAAQF